MGVWSAMFRVVLDPSHMIKAAADGFLQTLCQSLGKVSTDEAFIRAGQEAWGRACDTLGAEVAWEQAPEAVSIFAEREVQEGMSQGGEMSDGGEEVGVTVAEAEVSFGGGEEVVVSFERAEGRALGSHSGAEITEGERSIPELLSLCEDLAVLMGAEPSVMFTEAEAFDREGLTAETDGEGSQSERTVSEVRVAGKEASSAEPSLHTSLAENASARECCDFMPPVQEDAVEISSQLVIFLPSAATKFTLPASPAEHHQWREVQLPSIHEEGILSGDAFSLPESVGDVFSGPFDQETLPFSRGAAPSESSPSLVALPGIESPLEPAFCPLVADATDTTETVSPGEQIRASPETESACLLGECLTEPASWPLAADPSETIQTVHPFEQTIAPPETEGCSSAEACADLESRAHAGDASQASQALFSLEQIIAFVESEEASLSAEESSQQPLDSEMEAGYDAYVQACEAEMQHVRLMQEYEYLLQRLPAKYAALAQHVPYFQSCDLKCIGVLGHGGQASVAEVEATNAFGKRTTLALKVAFNGKIGDELLQEALNLIQNRSPYIIALCGFTLVGHRLGLLFEVADKGPLWKTGVQSTPMKLSTVVEHLIQVVTGVEFLHAQGVVHCDLKPGNTLPVNGVAKVSDLGYACKKELSYVQEGVGTTGYTAPEVGDRDENTTESDIWSVGALAFKALTGKSLLHRFKGDEQALFDHLQNGGSLPWPKSLRDSACGRNLIVLVDLCLSWEPARRPDARIVRIWLSSIFPLCKLWEAETSSGGC